VIFVHDLAFRVQPGEVPWQQRLYLGTTLGRALRAAAAVIAPSEATRRDLLQGFASVPRLEAKLHVVPEAPTPLPPPGRLPRKLRSGFLLAVGTVEPRKNYLRLLAAYRRLRLRLDVPLVVAGRPGWAYGEALEELRTQPGVVYLGHVDDATLSALYGGAKALAFPSVYEGFGLPLLDAMERGLPALIGNRGALPELAAGAALEVDPEDEAAIASGLQRLLTDVGLRRRLAAAGRKRAAEFSWQRSAGLVLDLLESTARKASEPGVVTI
jgi:glycosyltransferase involved in cell wall biosynthesis